MINAFSEGFRKGKHENGQKRLSLHRCRTVSDLHKDWKQVDCLDDPVYTIRKKERIITGKENTDMQNVRDKVFDEERALYGARGLVAENCRFDGPADGESAFKEGTDISVSDCFFNLRYPFWHDDGLKISNSELTELCRAALWYSRNIEIVDTKLHGIKALRECSDIKIGGCDIISPEFGWSVHGVDMQDCTVQSEYFMMRSDHLHFRNVQMKGKYSFQYISDCVFENCTFDTKDAFWHAKNIIVRNCTVKGEYLAWYSENITFEHCKIIGTQPLCYCRDLRLVDCEMIDTDLSFERSHVEATLTAPIVSIKNPLSGHISVPAVGEIIRDIPDAWGEIIISENQGYASKGEKSE